jgi:hypothetical protein
LALIAIATWATIRVFDAYQLGSVSQYFYSHWVFIGSFILLVVVITLASSEKLMKLCQTYIGVETNYESLARAIYAASDSLEAAKVIWDINYELMSDDEKIKLWQSYHKYQNRSAKVSPSSEKPILLHLHHKPSFVEPTDLPHLKLALLH